MLHDGLYEQIINRGLDAELGVTDKLTSTAPIDSAEASKVLAKYIAEVVEKGLDNVVDNGGDINSQVTLANRIISTTDDEDIKFVRNINTHCDFVIYNTLDKKIELVVEVDGSQHQEEIQSARDRRKDRLLQEANIRILRLPTTSMDCKERIIDALLKKNS